MGRYASNAGVPARRTAEPAGDAGGEDFGQRVAERARQLFDDEIGLRIGRSASDLTRLSNALRGAGSNLQGSVVGPYFARAAGQIDRAAELLQHTSSRELIEGVERFARSRPLLFAGGAVALGVSAGRFFKSSSGAALSSTHSTPATRATTPRRSTRNRSRQSSSTRGTSHE